VSWYEDRALEMLSDRNRQDGDERAGIVYALLAIAEALRGPEAEQSEPGDH
jgi:hypothetical protein